MKPIVKGMFARSLAGHDKGRLYVISDVQEPYVFLVDGKIRTATVSYTHLTLPTT